VYCRKDRQHHCCLWLFFFLTPLRQSVASRRGSVPLPPSHRPPLLQSCRRLQYHLFQQIHDFYDHPYLRVLLPHHHGFGRKQFESFSGQGAARYRKDAKRLFPFHRWKGTSDHQLSSASLVSAKVFSCFFYALVPFLFFCRPFVFGSTRRWMYSRSRKSW